MICRLILAAAFLCGGAGDSKSEKPLLRDIYGIDHYYNEFKQERTRAIVFVMLDDKCPVVKQQLPKLRELYLRYNTVKRDRAGHPVEFEKYPGDQIEFVGIYTKPDQSGRAVAEHAISTGIPFRVFRDTHLIFLKGSV